NCDATRRLAGCESTLKHTGISTLTRTMHQPQGSTLFPYTTLFRSADPTTLHRQPGGPTMFHQILVVERDKMIRALLHELLESEGDRKSTRLNSSHVKISYAVFCLKKKKKKKHTET